jgi:hypothetical protein
MVTAQSLANQENPMQPVIIARFIRSTYLLLERDRHRRSVGEFKLLHSGRISDLAESDQAFMLHYL